MNVYGTAFDTPLTVAEFEEYFLTSPNFVTCHLAGDSNSGLFFGFQALERHAELPDDWADIATFARPKPKVPGVGAALFAVTKVRHARWSHGMP
ncbi:MAG: hypothetical protein WAV18_32795 [Roseiarcus sp.]